MREIDHAAARSGRTKKALERLEKARAWRLLLLVGIASAAIFGAMGVIARSLLGRVVLIACLLGAMAGCHTISSTALDELRTAAAQSQANVQDSTVATSDNAKRALWTQGRVYADVLLDIDGTAIPDFYATDPWSVVSVVAPVGSK